MLTNDIEERCSRDLCTCHIPSTSTGAEPIDNEKALTESKPFVIPLHRQTDRQTPGITSPSATWFADVTMMMMMTIQFGTRNI